MKSLKLFITTLLFLGLSLLAACSGKESGQVIRVGTIAGPEADLMQVAQAVAARQFGLHIKIVTFTDYTMPNEALQDGSIDANMFQTIPYLDAYIKQRGYPLSIVGKTFIYPMAIYSKKITNIQDTPDSAIVAIPNDPSNEARALLLLQQAGLIKLRADAGIFATPRDIIENPKHLKIKPLSAAQLPRVLSDVTLAAINTNYAAIAGLSPQKDGLFMESKDSPYANVVVVRTADKDKPEFKQLVAALHSPEVLKAAERLFQGQAIPAWDTAKDSKLNPQDSA